MGVVLLSEPGSTRQWALCVCVRADEGTGLQYKTVGTVCVEGLMKGLACSIRQWALCVCVCVCKG